MSVLDWDGLVFYDKKIKKYIESKLADAGLSKDEIDNILNDYASKTYVTDEIAKAVTGGTIDLTGYAKTVDVNAKLDTKVDKVDGKSLVSDTEITRLSKISNYDDTSIKSSITSINSELANKANKSELFSGSYNDLTDKPTIPSLDGYAKKTDINMTLEEANNKLNEVLGTTDIKYFE